MRYQTFPWQSGSSRSFEKLLNLSLPPLKGKSLLDVGCNTGYFCGWAAFQKAARVRGIDRDQSAIALAKEWFPECSFNCMPWEELGPGRYDVVLCLSAIHYADDQGAMVKFLMNRVAPDGVLVLEMGVAPGEDEVFVPVTRRLSETKTDTRLFPTAPMLRKILSAYAHKYLGQSVPQAGDPLPRSVYHIRHKRPCAVLFMDRHNSGKSSTWQEIIRPDLPVLQLDYLFGEIAQNASEQEQALAAALVRHPGAQYLDSASTALAICRQGLLPLLLAACRQRVGEGSFVLDGYIPHDYRAKCCALLDRAGYFVVDVALYEAHQPPWTALRNEPAAFDAYTRYLERRMSIDEAAYLAANPDVAEAVAQGKLPSATYHYWHFGRKANRKLCP